MGHKLGTVDPVAINNSPIVRYRNADLELDKTDSGGNKENREHVPNIYKKHHI